MLSTELANQKNPHHVSFQNVHLAAAPPEPALRDTQFGEHLGEVLSFSILQNQARAGNQTLICGSI